MYALGVDLGTTFTAAATWRNGHAEIASLGSRAATVPSVVLLREDETFLTGDPANRRGLTEPHRVAREFKRRLGDTTPILLGGVPYSAEALMASLLRSVVEQVASREGGAPSAVCISHPANWGPYKTDLLRQAVRMAGIQQPVSFTTEPEAAAVFYARQQRVEAGAVVAVYDLGGGTFDAAVLRKTATGFEILGQPEGIERLGGIDIDAAVFSHVARALGGKLAELDEDDSRVIAAVARLREECVQAKEALSADTDASIPVLLPNISTEVRLTRSELEAMVRPALQGSIEALKRALESAGVTAEQLHSVLLVGGASRMPIVAQLVGAELGRPVAVDAHPKHAVALGAAWLASGSLAAAPAGHAPAVGPVAPAAPGGHVATGAAPVAPAVGDPRVAGTAAAGAAGVAGVAARPPIVAPVPAAAHTPPPSGPVSGGPVSGGPVSGGPAFPGQVSPAYAPAAQVSPAGGGVPPQTGRVYGGAPQPPAPTGPRRRGPLLVAAGVLAAVLVAAGGYAVATSSYFNDPTKTASGNESPDPVSSEARDPGRTGSGAASSGPAQSPSVEARPADELCTEEIQSNPRWVCLTSATFDGTTLTVNYDVDWDGGTPSVSGGYHLHIYGGDGTSPEDHTMGSHSGNPGRWYIEDQKPSVRTDSAALNAVGNAKKVCARIANSSHQLVRDGNGTYKTGNCVPITRG